MTDFIHKIISGICSASSQDQYNINFSRDPRHWGGFDLEIYKRGLSRKWTTGIFISSLQIVNNIYSHSQQVCILHKQCRRVNFLFIFCSFKSFNLFPSKKIIMKYYPSYITKYFRVFLNSRCIDKKWYFLLAHFLCGAKLGIHCDLFIYFSPVALFSSCSNCTTESQSAHILHPNLNLVIKCYQNLYYKANM